MWQTDSTGSDSTQRLGELLGGLLEPPAVVELLSDLGGGKTTFTKGLAKGLGYGDSVTSPTFTISREYPCADGTWLHHFDFYRLGEPGIIAETLKESLTDSKVITVVEWPQEVRSVLPQERLRVTLERRAEKFDERLITLHYPQRMKSLVQRLENAWAG